ncbi:type III-B CRISPR module-associated protein Cmr5 [Sulfolobus sp. E5]|nr:type III-B CRISPR module-associated protein Cmr5 [Sulfolobus sp. E5]
MNNEYVKFAADIGRKVVGCVASDEGKKSEKGNAYEQDKKAGLVRRAVDFPSLMLTAGFSSAFMFYLSKVENYKKLKNVLKYIESDDKKSLEDMCDEVKKDEGVGYTGYISILIKALKKIGKPIPNLDSLSDDKLYTELLNITDNVDFRDERLLLPYLYELKKVLEALPL